jgi:hypothetical protein
VLVWTQRLEEKSFASDGDRTPVVQSVVRHALTELLQTMLCGGGGGDDNTNNNKCAKILFISPCMFYLLLVLGIFRAHHNQFLSLLAVLINC